MSAQAVTPVVQWPPPASIPFRTPLSGVQLNAVALAGAPVPVPLNGFYNIEGITTNGVAFSNGGFDGSSWAYAAETLGTAIEWDNVSFPLGAPNADNVISGGTVPLPSGKFGSLLLLGDLVNNQQPPTATFVVTYTDGTSATFVQNMSDWVNARNYPGESIADCVPYRHDSDGSIDPNSVCVYGYRFTLDATRTVASVTLPQDRDVVVIAMAMMPSVVPGTFAYTPGTGSVLASGSQGLEAVFTPQDGSAFTSANASNNVLVTPPSPAVTPAIAWPLPAPIPYQAPLTGTQLDAAAQSAMAPVQVPLGADYRVNALYADGTVFEEKGFDGSSTAFSDTALGGAVKFAGTTFALGPPGVPDAATSSTIALPEGNFGALDLVGAAAVSAQPDQTFTVTYTDGTTTAGALSLSTWESPQSFPGESIVASIPYADTANGESVSGVYDLYGYTIPLDATRTVASLTLPANANVILLAVGLDPGNTFAVDGQYDYTPPAGTVLPLGTNALSVGFTPADSTDFTAASGTSSVVVEKPVLTLSANSATRVYGTANPAFSGTLAGAVGNDRFTESFSSAAAPLSPAGTYAIVPAAAGADLALYQQIVQDGVLTVTQAPVVVSVSAASGLQGQATPITVTVQSTTQGTPTGSVSVYAGGVLLGSAALNGGTASAPVILPVGSNTVTASYAGDTNFLPATSAAGPTITVTPLDFALSAPNGTTFAGVIGQRPSLMLLVSPLHGVYASNVSFSVSGTLPQLATTSFSPASVSATAGATEVSFTVATRTLSGANLGDGSRSSAPWLCCLLALPLAALRRKLPRAGRLLLVLAGVLSLGLGLSALSGCGSGYRPASYPLVITASDGTVQHSVTITLNIQGPAQ